MEIKYIRLKNFRQFKGDQKIELAPKGHKNVTLIHAENGVGKTTLLNSVLWALFGKTTAKFEHQEKIINFDSIECGENTAAVEVLFTHERIDYLAVRNYTENKGGLSPKTNFKVMRVNSDGSYSASLPNPDSFVATVMPPAMAPYFFFDGEQAETFAHEKNKKEISKAIRNILGSTMVETAVKDLNYLARKFNEEIGDLTTDDELRGVEREIEKKEKEKDALTLTRQQLTQNIETLDEQLSTLKEQQLNAAEAKHIASALEASRIRLEAVKSGIKDKSKQVVIWISKNAVPMVSKKLSHDALSFVDEQSLHGRIPSPYNEEFVNGILESQLCICGRPVHAGTQEWSTIKSMLTGAANADLLDKFLRARGRLTALEEAGDAAPDILFRIQEELAQLENERNELERKIEMHLKQIEGLRIEEIQQRAVAIERLQRQRDGRISDRAVAESKLKEIVESLRKLNDQLVRLAINNEAAKAPLLRRELSLACAEYLREHLQKNEDRARQDIEDAVNRILEKTTRRHYRFEIDKDFSIRLLFSNGMPVPKSGGENQMVSLAFLAALVEYAEKRSKMKQGLFIPATVAPLILDSPFGQLDDAYRKATARFVPEMAPQIVLLVSSSQAMGILEVLEEKIGREYVLVAHNVGEIGEKKPDYITVGGKKTQSTLYGQSSNMTKIEGVRS